MRKTLLTALMTLAWLLASPSLQLPQSGWLEVGAPDVMAQEFKGIMVEPAAQPKASKKKASKKKAKTKRVGSSRLVTSNQPGFHPIPDIMAPAQPRVTGTVRTPERDPRYPNVPTVSTFGPETSQDRVARCAHQGSLGGLSAGQQGAYIHNCAF